jgi:Zn-dependent peptidase ImmA (M78 family)
MKEKIPINPQILYWARISSGYAIDDIAKKMDQAETEILQWEDGTSSPSYTQLEKLAYQIYKRPIAIFFFPSPPEEIKPEKSFRTLPSNEIRKLSPSILKLFRKAQAMQIILSEMNSNINPAENKIFKDIFISPVSSVEEVIQTVREYLGVTLEEQLSWNSFEKAFDTWRDSIEKKGIFVFKDAFKQDDVSGFCIYDEVFPVIYINNSSPKTRQIFTIFHELAHLLQKTGGIDKIFDDYINNLFGENKKIEYFCNNFAANFLVPQNDFNYQIKNKEINDRRIEDLSKRYRVSREVILRFLLDRGLVTTSKYNEKVKEWIKDLEKMHNTGSGGNYYATKIAYLGENYLSLAFSKYYKNKISIDQLAEYLDVRTNNVSNIEAHFLAKGLSK